LWTEFAGKEFYAKMAENSTNDENGNAIASTYATKETATSLTDGLLSHEDKRKLDAMDPTWLIYRVRDASGNIPKFRVEGDLEDSEIAVSDVATVVQNSHFHSNKDVLDEIPSPLNPENSMLLSESDNTQMKWVNWNFVNVSKKTDNSVLIGKTWYPYVKIGNYYWTTENLREPIGTKGTDYWVYDENTVVERGFIYKHETIIKGQQGVESDALLALLHDGWHIPEQYEARALLSYQDPYYWEHNGIRFFATDADRLMPKPVTPGTFTDTLGFHAYPSGEYRLPGHGWSDQGFNNMTLYAFYYTKTPYRAANQVYNFHIQYSPGNYSAGIDSFGGETYLYGCVRLCKSVT
jgi:uncharacterized protein (TIGR02145 family)